MNFMEKAGQMPFRKGGDHMPVKRGEKKTRVPLWEKFMLTVSEAAEYFNIGENKLRDLISCHKDAEWIFHIGERTMIKREQFEHFLAVTESI